MRVRIVQIVAVPENEYNNAGLYALCEDGSLWLLIITREKGGIWKRIPQPEDDSQ